MFVAAVSHSSYGLLPYIIEAKGETSHRLLSPALLKIRPTSLASTAGILTDTTETRKPRSFNGDISLYNVI